MTVPEENRPKTETTDEVVTGKDDTQRDAPGGTGRTVREAMEEAGVRPEDFAEG
ncbi:hypothetical protein [Streptomyces sp. A012304]|uniref:hypothetical protein n=1 Tax=Streptomyces sp. A012304 TaxID=375446 RepID=UPI00222E8A25|nr:hypothetical protein [Streptomyces sp. A012304]GKQ41502.1 hypothetical protein ALMP_80170 [Streptomyces sp. A012304]